MIDDVIAVRAPGPGTKIGRAVDVTDAKVREVRHDSHGIPKPEARVQLQAVGRARNA